MNQYEITTLNNKQTIVLTALHLFKDLGYKKTNMKLIASESGVSLASIYNYYKNKEEVLSECIKYTMVNLHKQTDEILDEPISFEDKLIKVVLLCSFEENESIFTIFSEAALKDQRMRELLITYINQEKKDIYIKIIEYGRNHKDLNTNIPTALYLGYIEALNEFGTSLDYKANFRESIEGIHSLILYGLLGQRNL